MQAARPDENGVRLPRLRVSQQLVFRVALQQLRLHRQSGVAQDLRGMFQHANQRLPGRGVLFTRPLRGDRFRPRDGGFHPRIHHRHDAELAELRPHPASHRSHCRNRILRAIRRHDNPGPCVVRMLSRGREMRTEHGHSAATFCDTLPRKSRSSTERPWEPSATRSAFHWVAWLSTPHAGESAQANDSTFHFGCSVLSRSAARADIAFALSSTPSACARALRTASEFAAGKSGCGTIGIRGQPDIRDGENGCFHLRRQTGLRQIFDRRLSARRSVVSNQEFFHKLNSVTHARRALPSLGKLRTMLRAVVSPRLA